MVSEITESARQVNIWVDKGLVIPEIEVETSPKNLELSFHPKPLNSPVQI